MTSLRAQYDLAVVGAGIVGLAAALAGVRRGYRVVVIDRDAQANGASVRNFGFVTLSGQQRGALWQRARRSREVWREVSAAAGIPVLQSGVWVVVRRPESLAVLSEFLAGEMSEGCRLLDPSAARQRFPQLAAAELAGVLESTSELRVESREAIPRLADWLATEHGVSFLRGTQALAVEPPLISTTRGPVRAEQVVVCPGDDFHGLYADRLAAYPLTRCKLQMMRLAAPGFRLPAAVMSDLSLGRYAGFAELTSAAALKARLAREQPQYLQHGVHLIVVQSADGTLIVGDSHHYAATPDPFALSAVDELILAEFRAALGFEPPPVIERWIGTYASAPEPVLIDAPHPQVRIALVTSGAGASIGFALAEEVIASLDALKGP